MFERFGADARQAVALAAREATELRHGYIGCGHLLLALSGGVGTPAAGALAAFGLRPPDLRERVLRVAGPGDATLDGDALASVGIDLDAVRRATEASFGPGALDREEDRPGRRGLIKRLRFTDRARTSLQLAKQTAARSGDTEITTGHLLLGVIGQRDNTALRVLEAAGVGAGPLRREVARRMAAA